MNCKVIYFQKKYYFSPFFRFWLLFISGMFYGCTSLRTIRMVGCSEATINKIKEQLKTDGITGANIETT